VFNRAQKGKEGIKMTGELKPEEICSDCPIKNPRYANCFECKKEKGGEGDV